MNFYDILLAKKLSGGGGGDITTETLNVTANGQYTAPQGKAYTPVNVDIKGYKVGEVDVPTDIASFTASDAPLKSLTASIVPVQDLHGQDAPWAGGAGKNKLGLPYTGTSQTSGGITVTVNDDGTVRFVGESSSDFYWTFKNDDKPFTLPAGTYTWSSVNSIPPYVAVYYGSVYLNTSNLSRVITYSETTTNSIYIQIPARAGRVDFTVKMQIESGQTVTEWTPFSNICPISGWDECKVSVVGKNKSPLISSTTSSNGGLESNSNKIYEFIKKGKTYTLSFDMIVAQKSETTQGNTLSVWLNNTSPSVARFPVSSTGRQTATFTASSDGFLNFWSGNNSYDANTKVIDNIQLEEGSTATTYEPYAGTTTTIPFTDGQGQSVGVFGGSVDVVNGGEQQRTLGFADLGDLEWSVVSGTTNVFNAVVPNIKYPASSSERNKGLICSCYKLNSNTYLDDRMDDKSMGRINGRVYIRDTSYTDATAFKNSLQNSNAQLVYELATPTTFYTQPTSIKSLDGDNNVSASTGQIEDLEYFEEL